MIKASRRTRTDTGEIGSVETALALLDLFEREQSVRVIDVSKLLSVSSSSAHRLLNTFEHRGYVQQDRPHGAYSVGPKLTRLAAELTTRAEVRWATQTLLVDLASEIDETVCVAILHGTEVQFVSAVESRRRSAAIMPRTMMPTHSTAAGKALICDYNRAEVEQLYPSEQLPRLTSKTLTSRESLLRDLQRTRERGYAIHAEETHPHYIAYGYPIRDQTGVTRAAFVAVGPTQRFGLHSSDALIEMLRSAVAAPIRFP